MLLYSWREQVRVYGLAAIVLIAAFAMFRHTAAAQPLFYLAFIYSVLWVGTTPKLRRFVPPNDYSYGIYLYGFVMQQCVANLLPHLDHLQAVLVAAPLILICAVCSWHFVERPALRWCRRRVARAPLEPAPSVITTDGAVR